MRLPTLTTTKSLFVFADNTALMIWPKATGNYDWRVEAGTLQTFIL